jgi:hypothetical protein
VRASRTGRSCTLTVNPAFSASLMRLCVANSPFRSLSRIRSGRFETMGP